MATTYEGQLWKEGAKCLLQRCLLHVPQLEPRTPGLPQEATEHVENRGTAVAIETLGFLKL